MNKAKLGKSPFAKLGGVALVVDDIDKAVEFFSSLGLGPFVPPNWPLCVETWEGGKPADIQMKLKFGHWGEVEIELIQPLTQCLQMDYLKKTGGGIHHVSFFVDDLDGEVDKMVKQGIKVTQSGRRAKGGGYTLFDTEMYCGTVIELTQR